MSDEAARLRALVEVLGEIPMPSVTLPTGTASVVLDASQLDDAAVIRSVGSVEFVVASDYVRGPEFTMYKLGHLTLYDLGYYLAVANISDLAAMGATPLALLAVVRYPAEMTVDDYADVIRGVRDASDVYGAAVIGGDSGTAERLILSATAIGVVSPGRALLRSGARPGDLVFVTGEIGTAGAAILYFSEFQRGLGQATAATESALLHAWARPTARVTAGRAFAEGEGITACQDTSDGLFGTLGELGRANAVGFHLASDALPVPAAVTEVAEILGLDRVGLACSASVDFELVVTVDPAHAIDVRTRMSLAGIAMHEIGTVVATPGVVCVEDGVERPLIAVPWNHQNEDPAAAVRAGLTQTRSAPE